MLPSYPGDKRPEMYEKIARAKAGDEDALRELRIRLALAAKSLPDAALCDLWDLIVETRNMELRKITEQN